MDYKEKVIALLNSKELSQKQKEKLKDIFPELKEDEDERIRKDIIAYLQYAIGFDKTFIDKKFNWSQKGCSKWITWLKEQGEYVNFLSKIQIGDKVTRNKDGVLVNLSQLNRIVKPDKAKPNFKVGDFIVSAYCIGKVIELTNDAYLLDTGQGIPFSYEHNAHLWTIKDAKNGDVLNSIRVKATIIFKEWNLDGKHINAYCALQKGILIKQEMIWDRDFEPATKEQCDTLKKAMTDAGLEFDFDKKELKKIEKAK